MSGCRDRERFSAPIDKSKYPRHTETHATQSLPNSDPRNILLHNAHLWKIREWVWVEGSGKQMQYMRHEPGKSPAEDRR